MVFSFCWPVQEDFQWPVYTLVDSVMPRKHQLDDIPAVDYLRWRWLSQGEIFQHQSFQRLGQTKSSNMLKSRKKTRLILFQIYTIFFGGRLYFFWRCYIYSKQIQQKPFWVPLFPVTGGQIHWYVFILVTLFHKNQLVPAEWLMVAQCVTWPFSITTSSDLLVVTWCLEKR